MSGQLGRTRAARLAIKLEGHCRRSLTGYATFKKIRTTFESNDDSFGFMITGHLPDYKGSTTLFSNAFRKREASVFVRVYPDLEIQVEAEPNFPKELLDCIVSAGAKFSILEVQSV